MSGHFCDLLAFVAAATSNVNYVARLTSTNTPLLESVREKCATRVGMFVVYVANKRTTNSEGFDTQRVRAYKLDTSIRGRSGWLQVYSGRATRTARSVRGSTFWIDVMSPLH